MSTRIVARSFREAAEFLPQAGDIGVVSLGSPGSDPPQGFNPSNENHIRLTFEDIDFTIPVLRESDAYVCPTRGDVQTILDAGEHLLEKELVYTHCRAGVSRSTATAYMLRCLRDGPGAEANCWQQTLQDRPIARPNRAMVRLADDILNRNGRMFEQIQDR